MIKGVKVIKPDIKIEKYKGKDLTADITCSKDVLNQLLEQRKGTLKYNEDKYHDYDKVKYHDQITVIEPVEFGMNSTAYSDWKNLQDFMNGTYIKMIREGRTASEVKNIFTNSVATDVRLTASIDEWRDMLQDNCSKYAPANMQQVMIPILKEYQKILPKQFNDIEYNKAFKEKKYARIIEDELDR